MVGIVPFINYYKHQLFKQNILIKLDFELIQASWYRYFT